MSLSVFSGSKTMALLINMTMLSRPHFHLFFLPADACGTFQKLWFASSRPLLRSPLPCLQFRSIRIPLGSQVASFASHASLRTVAENQMVIVVPVSFSESAQS